MVTHPQAVSRRSGAATAGSLDFEAAAGLCAIIAAITSFLYAVAFIVLKSAGPSALFLLLGGLLASPVLVAMYNRLRETAPAAALWAFLLSGAGSLGAAIHGGYDLANALHPPRALPDIPNPVDPRGLLAFGVTGLGLAALARLIERDDRFPRGLGLVGYATAILLIVLYLGRLVVLDTKSPLIVIPALLNGFILYPAWYIWLGLTLWRRPTQVPTSAAYEGQQ